MADKNLESIVDILEEKKPEQTVAPFVGDIEKETTTNTFFRKILFTGKHSQLVVMSLKEDEEIGNEVHEKVDQFFRIERGEAKFVLDNKKEHVVKDGGSVVVPAGTYHNVINVGKGHLKLYTVYSPADHPAKADHKTKAEADAAEEKENKEMKENK
jgi:mannose-6-phosphate isomerase-like protein (cupin superfamily)